MGFFLKLPFKLLQRWTKIRKQFNKKHSQNKKIKEINVYWYNTGLFILNYSSFITDDIGYTTNVLNKRSWVILIINFRVINFCLGFGQNY